MKTTQLYCKTKDDLAKKENEKKVNRFQVILGVIMVLVGILFFAKTNLPVLFTILLVIVELSLIYLIITKPWIKVVKPEEITDLEVEYELNIQLIEKETSLDLLKQQVSDMWDNLDPHKPIEARMEILPLDQEIIALYEEICEINDTLEIEKNPIYIKDVENIQEEIVLINEFFEKSKKES